MIKLERDFLVISVLIVLLFSIGVSVSHADVVSYDRTPDSPNTNYLVNGTDFHAFPLVDGNATGCVDPTLTTGIDAIYNSRTATYIQVQALSPTSLYVGTYDWTRDFSQLPTDGFDIVAGDTISIVHFDLPTSLFTGDATADFLNACYSNVEETFTLIAPPSIPLDYNILIRFTTFEAVSFALAASLFLYMGLACMRWFFNGLFHSSRRGG